uniref:Homeobox domain-containing protein n=1 Tax=Peromyscus maniculatus bairdii TaxID=230844 RepID=A0A8C8URG8_PERMB
MSTSSHHLCKVPLHPRSLLSYFSWEQLWELERQFKLEPYPDLEARRVLATRLNLKEEQVETWFIQRSLEQEMCPRIARLQQSVRPSLKFMAWSPNSWDYRCAPPCPAQNVCLIFYFNYAYVCGVLWM